MNFYKYVPILNVYALSQVIEATILFSEECDIYLLVKIFTTSVINIFVYFYNQIRVQFHLRFIFCI